VHDVLIGALISAALATPAANWLCTFDLYTERRIIESAARVIYQFEPDAPSLGETMGLAFSSPGCCAMRAC